MSTGPLSVAWELREGGLLSSVLAGPTQPPRTVTSSIVDWETLSVIWQVPSLAGHLESLKSHTLVSVLRITDTLQRGSLLWKSMRRHQIQLAESIAGAQL